MTGPVPVTVDPRREQDVDDDHDHGQHHHHHHAPDTKTPQHRGRETYPESYLVHTRFIALRRNAAITDLQSIV